MLEYPRHVSRGYEQIQNNAYRYLLFLILIDSSYHFSVERGRPLFASSQSSSSLTSCNFFCRFFVLVCALAKRYIDINYSKNITLDSLAEITHINKFYLAHSFTECIGQSPINYLADRRIEACKELLTTSDLSVTQIASSAGFSSQSYFSQIFNKKVGMSPRQYRKLYSHEKQE